MQEAFLFVIIAYVNICEYCITVQKHVCISASNFSYNMFFEALFIFELFLLYLLSYNVSILLSRFLPIHLLALLFLPGTLLHEIAHWLAAVLLFVSVGNISLIPKLEKGGLKLGSVSIEKTDPARRFLIGSAPVFLGVSIIIVGIYFALNNDLLNNYWSIPILSYIIFVIGNTMFSSKKDMEGALKFSLVILLLGSISYLLGLRIQITMIIDFLSQPFVVDIFQKGSTYLLFPIIIDASFILILRIFHR